jgi:hypothetical protein
MYMLKDPVPRSKLYGDYLAVQTYGLLQLADKNLTDISEAIRSSLLRPYFVNGVMSEYGAVRSQFLTRKGNACRDNWHPGKLDRLADEVGYLGEYQFIQRSLSNSVHSTPFGLFNGAGVNDSLALHWAWVFNFRIIGGIVRYVGTIQLDEFETWATRMAMSSVTDVPPSEGWMSDTP